MFAPVPHAAGTSHVLPISTARSCGRSFRKLVCPTSSPSKECANPMSTLAHHSSKCSLPQTRCSSQMRGSAEIACSSSWWRA
jgi:hypothetical protein